MRMAGGIITIVVGVVMVVAGAFAAGVPWSFIPELAEAPAGVAGGIIALGVVALIGGIYAIRARIWGLALAGAICSAFPANPAGVVAIVFIALTKREFE